MESAKVSVAEIKSRGQLTIPKKIREISHLEEGQVVTIIPVGDPLQRNLWQKKEVKIFLDSNVIISGLFSDKGAPRIILDLLCLDLPVLAGMTGNTNISEINGTIKKKIRKDLP